MEVEAVFFDLDGTLIHTLADLGVAMNSALEEQSLPTHPIENYAGMIGGGMAKLVDRASSGKGNQTQLISGLMRHYNDHYVRETRAYPGIHHLLARLREAGIITAVVSNKHDGMTQEVVRRIFPDAGFAYVRGYRAPVPKKPDPAPLERPCRVLDVRQNSVLYVGDTEVDVEAAVRAGIQPVGVSWGYRVENVLLDAGAKWILRDPMELLDMIGVPR